MRRLLSWMAGVACGAGAFAAEPVKPFQRSLSVAPRAGWVQVQLDAEAQRWAETLWIGDEDGRPVPFLRESGAPTRSVALRVENLLTGTDDAGRATAEFRVSGTAGESIVQLNAIREIAPGALGAVPDTRSELRLAPEISADRPWVAEVEIARRSPSGEWVTLDQRVQLYDFGGEYRRTEFAVPRESAEWRLRLRAIQGQVRGVRSVAARLPGLALPVATHQVGLGVSRYDTGWTLTLPENALRVLAVNLTFKGTVAPVRAELWRLDDDEKRKEESLSWAGAEQVWSMPGLESQQGQVRLAASMMAERFRVKVPDGVEIAAATAEVAGESLWFVAEKNQQYALHLAGQRKTAAGDLAALPAQVDAPLPMILWIGAAQPDPFGTPLKRDVSEVLRGWLPWIVAVAVAVLAGVALRMMRVGRKEE